MYIYIYYLSIYLSIYLDTKVDNHSYMWVYLNLVASVSLENSNTLLFF